VVAPKDFSGIVESTLLSRTFQAQGIRLHKRKKRKLDELDEAETVAQAATGKLMTVVSDSHDDKQSRDQIFQSPLHATHMAKLSSGISSQSATPLSVFKANASYTQSQLPGVPDMQSPYCAVSPHSDSELNTISPQGALLDHEPYFMYPTLTTINGMSNALQTSVGFTASELPISFSAHVQQGNPPEFPSIDGLVSERSCSGYCEFVGTDAYSTERVSYGWRT
jgi:hypothetical protein